MSRPGVGVGSGEIHGIELQDKEWGKGVGGSQGYASSKKEGKSQLCLSPAFSGSDTGGATYCDIFHRILQATQKGQIVIEQLHLLPKLF